MNREVVSNSLNNVLKDISLYPASNGDTPESIGWEQFFADHPHFVQHYYGTALGLATGGRELLEGMEPHKQRLGGVIIRSQFKDKEIENYGREEV